MSKTNSNTDLTLRTIDTDTTGVTSTTDCLLTSSFSPNTQSSASSSSSSASSARDRFSSPIIPETEPPLTNEEMVVVASEIDNENQLKELSLKRRHPFDDIRIFTFFMCLIVMLTNALIVGYRNSVVTTIEKRYEFSSVFSGVLSGCLEFGSLVATLFVSYFCSKSHIPRCIAIGSLLCGLGALLYALPHLLWSSSSLNSGNRKIVSSSITNDLQDDLVCQAVKLSSNMINMTSELPVAAVLSSSILDKLELINSECLLKPSNFSHFVILIIANILIGSSSAPLYTLGTSYIDQHVEKDNSSVYLG